MTLPAKLTAGDALSKTVSLADYPANAGWMLYVVLVSTTAKIRIDALAAGASHQLNILSSNSTSYAPGDYAWQAYVERLGARQTIATGRITILPNFAAAAGGIDTRSHARRTLQAIEATIEGRASSDVLAYEIAGRRLSKIPVTELLELRDRYRRDVRAEDAAEAASGGGVPKNKIFVRL